MADSGKCSLTARTKTGRNLPSPGCRSRRQHPPTERRLHGPKKKKSRPNPSRIGTHAARSQAAAQKPGLGRFQQLAEHDAIEGQPQSAKPRLPRPPASPANKKTPPSRRRKAAAQTLTRLASTAAAATPPPGSLGLADSGTCVLIARRKTCRNLPSPGCRRRRPNPLTDKPPLRHGEQK